MGDPAAVVARTFGQMIHHDDVLAIAEIQEHMFGAASLLRVSVGRIATNIVACRMRSASQRDYWAPITSHEMLTVWTGSTA